MFQGPSTSWTTINNCWGSRGSGVAWSCGAFSILQQKHAKEHGDNGLMACRWFRGTGTPFFSPPPWLQRRAAKAHFPISNLKHVETNFSLHNSHQTWESRRESVLKFWYCFYLISSFLAKCESIKTFSPRTLFNRCPSCLKVHGESAFWDTTIEGRGPRIYSIQKDKIIKCIGADLSIKSIYPPCLYACAKTARWLSSFCASKQRGLSPAGGFQTPASIVAETSQGMQSLFDLGLLWPGNMEIW